MRHSVFALMLTALSLSLYPTFALAQHAGAGGAPAPRTDASNSNSRPDLNQPQVDRVDDRRFLQNAAMSGLADVALGKLAVEKGASDAVKQFGQRIIDDHTKANDELKQLAAAGNVQVSDALDAKHQSRVDKLAKLSGAEFDKVYIKDQVKSQHQSVKDFELEAQYGSVAEVKNFASKALPTLKQHLELATDLNKSKK